MIFDFKVCFLYVFKSFFEKNKKNLKKVLTFILKYDIISLVRKRRRKSKKTNE